MCASQTGNTVYCCLWSIRPQSCKRFQECYITLLLNSGGVPLCQYETSEVYVIEYHQWLSSAIEFCCLSDNRIWITLRIYIYTYIYIYIHILYVYIYIYIHIIYIHLHIIYIYIYIIIYIRTYTYIYINKLCIMCVICVHCCAFLPMPNTTTCPLPEDFWNRVLTKGESCKEESAFMKWFAQKQFMKISPPIKLKVLWIIASFSIMFNKWNGCGWFGSAWHDLQLDSRISRWQGTAAGAVTIWVLQHSTFRSFRMLQALWHYGQPIKTVKSLAMSHAWTWHKKTAKEEGSQAVLPVNSQSDLFSFMRHHR